MSLSNGSRYEGDWKNDVMSGLGRLFYDSGSLAYEGGFLNNKVDGHGIMYNELIGQASQPKKASLLLGDLDLVQDDWISFEGVFKQDAKHGPGQWSLANGDVFSGEFANDKANGKGVYRISQRAGEAEQRLVGVWDKNKLAGILN